MKITRLITDAASDPFVGLSWRKVDVEVCAADPAARVCLTDIEVPAHWSREAAQTFVHYYIRRAGVPAKTLRVKEEGIPEFLWCAVPDTAALQAMPEEQRYSHETSARQVFLRLAGMWTYWGFKCGYFDTESDAQSFHDEIAAMLARQVMAPNSPQWFNTGLHWAYGLRGPAQGHCYGDHETGKLKLSSNAYARPQLHACFLHSVRDELVSEGGIMHLFEREMRAFKYGSGVGANMSAIRGRGEELSSGASALGLMRFLTIGDKAAGAIHSGGLPRRAGKMVVVDIDHPDVVSFIRWKGEEQYKIAALITGARVMRKYLSGVMAAVQTGQSEARYDPQHNTALAAAIGKAKRAMIPTSAIERVIAYARQGYRELHIPMYGAEAESDVFFTVSAHQTRQAVRVTDRFMQAVADRQRFALRKRTDGEVSSQQQAGDLFDDMAHAVWATGEPTIQFADTIAANHTCPETDSIRASTPASEYLFLDDTACPLASINLLACADSKGFINTAMFGHVARIASIMLDISVTMAQYPSRAMARRTLDTRPIGLGLANFAPLVMRMGYAYDSDEARATAAALSSLMTGEACAVSAELAKELGAFNEFAKNRRPFLQWVAARRDLLIRESAASEALHLEALPQTALLDAARRVWEIAFIKTEAYGVRNAQFSCVPPTTTIARVMDCDTLGLAPVRGLMRRDQKKLSADVNYGLQALGYSHSQIADMARYVCGTASLAESPHINTASLKALGFSEAQLIAIEEGLETASDIHAAFDPFVLGERFCRETLRISDEQMYDARFNLLAHIGFSARDIAAADAYLCGARTLAGAPHLRAEDEAVFAQQVTADAQIDLLAAAQAFLTGGIAHTVLLGQAATLEECQRIIRSAWQKGLKSITIKREHCALYEEAMASDDVLEERRANQNWVFSEAQTMMSGSVSAVAAQLLSQFMKTRRELPLRRKGFTQKTTIGGQPVYLRTGEYEDGTLGELALDMPAASESTRALLQQFSRAISIALQYGVPMAAFVDAFARGTMKPLSPQTMNATSAVSMLLNHIFSELAASYMIDPLDVPSAAAPVRAFAGQRVA
jgi:ribonucleoside-diphosphate reductase alpha chain